MRMRNCNFLPGFHPHLRTSRSPRMPPGPVWGSDWLSRVDSLMWLPKASSRKETCVEFRKHWRVIVSKPAFRDRIELSIQSKYDFHEIDRIAWGRIVIH